MSTSESVIDEVASHLGPVQRKGKALGEKIHGEVYLTLQGAFAEASDVRKHVMEIGQEQCWVMVVA
jgi:hypothetical protein